MKKAETINFKDFMSGDYKKVDYKKDYILVGKVIAGATTILVLTTSKVAFASNGDEFLYDDIMELFDKGVVLVIVFAGACWSLGHRSKALEILIGVCIGYLLARKAVVIRDYLKGV